MTQNLSFLFLNSYKTKMGHMWTQKLSSAQVEIQTVVQTAPAQHSRIQELVVPCIHASRAAFYSLQFTFLHHCWDSLTDFRNAHANKPRIRVTRHSPCFLQLLGKVSPHSCKKTVRQLLPSTGLARCSFSASPAPVSSLSGHLVFSTPLWKGWNCSYHGLGHDKEVLLQLVEQQVSTHHAVHLDRYRSIGVCLSLGSQVHLQESHSCEQAKHHHRSWCHMLYNRNKLELLLCARILSSHQNFHAVTSATWSTYPEIPVQTT